MKLFSYGSLKKNHYNHRLLGTSKFLYETNIPGYILYDTGHYPVAVRSDKSGDYINGEVYEIDENVWGVLLDVELNAGYIKAYYKDLHFFEYKNWLRAVTKFKYTGHIWK